MIERRTARARGSAINLRPMDALHEQRERTRGRVVSEEHLDEFAEDEMLDQLGLNSSTDDTDSAPAA